MSVNITTEGDDLVIRVSLNVVPALSASGKSYVIGSTQGFVGQSTPFGSVKIGLNVITTDAGYLTLTQPAAAPQQPRLVKAAGK